MLCLNLIPMLDILSVLVFFLLFHSFNRALPEQRLKLPESIVETKPRGTLATRVTPEAVLIQGKAVIRITDLLMTASGSCQKSPTSWSGFNPYTPGKANHHRE